MVARVDKCCPFRCFLSFSLRLGDILPRNLDNPTAVSSADGSGSAWGQEGSNPYFNFC